MSAMSPGPQKAYTQLAAEQLAARSAPDNPKPTAELASSADPATKRHCRSGSLDPCTATG